jgi:hypothetical protein
MTQRRVNAEAVLALIADTLLAVAEYSKSGCANFAKTVTDAKEAQKNAEMAKKKKRLAVPQKRSAELKKLICKIYKGSILGKLPEARRAALDESAPKSKARCPKKSRGLKRSSAAMGKAGNQRAS